MNVPPPYWAFAWAGGQALARFLLMRPTASEKSPSISARARASAPSRAAWPGRILRPGGGHSTRWPSPPFISTLQGQWHRVETTGDDLLQDAPGRWARVLVGDLFYERALADRVASFIERAAADGALVLIGDPKRSYFPQARFTLEAEYSVPVTRDLEDAEIKRAAVWRA